MNFTDSALDVEWLRAVKIKTAPQFKKICIKTMVHPPKNASIFTIPRIRLSQYCSFFSMYAQHFQMQQTAASVKSLNDENWRKKRKERIWKEEMEEANGKLVSTVPI